MSIKSDLADFVAIAEEEARIEYAEGDGKVTKYGKEFGQNGGDWCAWFVAWCAKQAGILTDASSGDCPLVPELGYVPDVYKWYKAIRRNLIPKMNSSSANYPKVGDLAIIDVEGKSDDKNHIGIICEVSGTKVTVIEGNDWDKKLGKCRVKKIPYNNLVCDNQTISYLCSNNVSF